MITSRKTLALFLGSVVLLAGFYFTLDKLRITLEGQLADRFTQAIDQLGKDNLELRLGGIYALERIARGSETDHWPVMEVLTTYIRAHASWKENRSPQDEPPPQKLTADIQAILTVLGRRERTYKNGEDLRLDLRGTDLRRANLSGAHLEGAILSEVRLEEANLAGINLEEAILREARLEHSNLTEANLQGAFLLNTSFKGARLRNANLQGAFLGGTRFDEADLLGADFTDAFGLTWEQIQTAKRDHKTRFPDYLKVPGPVEQEAR
ncbi:MAG: pentapeptide repeat-containing protein [Nitrospirae bacterium]|nr:pentapeptide repeat-containing protein [Nitrospirota bacterium]